MRRLWAGVLALSLGGLALAWDDPKTEGKQDPPSRADRLKAAKKDYDDFMKDFMPKYREAGAKEDKKLQEELMKGYTEARKKAGDAAFKLAEEDPKDDAGLEAMVYAMGMGLLTGDQPKQAKDWINSYHLANPKVKGAIGFLGRGEEGKAFLLAVLDKNPDKEVKGLACYQLGEAAASALGRTTDKEKAADLEAEAMKYFDRVKKEFADVKHYRGTLGAAVDSEVYELTYLRVGKTVPEVEGEDVDGAKFKLSDYRGKVVMVDFWGHW